MNLAQVFENFRKITDDIPAAILAVGSILTSQQIEAKSLTVKDASKLLNVSADAVYQMCDSGTLKHHRIGAGRGTIRILSADLVDCKTKQLNGAHLPLRVLLLRAWPASVSECQASFGEC